MDVFAGTGMLSSEDGQPLQCSFSSPYEITVDEMSGTYFITETRGNLVRAIKCV